MNADATALGEYSGRETSYYLFIQICIVMMKIYVVDVALLSLIE